MNPPGTAEHSAEHGAITQWALMIAKAAALGVVGVEVETDVPPSGFGTNIEAKEGSAR